MKFSYTFAGIPKSLKASLSDHALGRQALPVLFTHPQTYFRNAAESIANIVRVIGGKNAVDGTRAYMYNDPLFEEMKKAGLAVNMKGEEAYPTDIPSKIPVLGRLYKSSKDSFEILNATNRFDLYKQLREVGEKTGVNVEDPAEQKSLANMINSLTGRGNLKGTGASTSEKVTNALFFSPRLWKSHFDVLTAHMGQGETTFVKKQAALNLIKIIGGMATIAGLANVFRPNSATLDTNSSDFGKIKVGDTRFDFTGGASNLMVLASRLIHHSTTSSTTGKTTPIDAKNSNGAPLFGAKTTQDVIKDYVEGKLSPTAAAALFAYTGSDAQGNKATPGAVASSLLLPLPVESYNELAKNPKAANKLAVLLAEAIGVGVNTYAPTEPSVSAQVKTIKEATQTPVQKMINAQRAAKAKATRLKNEQKILNQAK